MSEDTPVADFTPWDVESLRLTIFHSTTAPISGLWERLMGIGPESVDSRPREHVLREQGGANGDQLLLAAQPQRLDWHLVPSPSVGPGTRSSPILTAVNQAAPVLRKALDVSLHSLQQVHRLAFGAVLAQQASSLDQGMGQLSRCLPHMHLEYPMGRDFIYQINRRRQSRSAPHVLINRIAKWQLEEFHGGALLIGPSQNPQWQPTSGIVSKLILDINTAAESNAIAVDRMPSLFIELVTFAYEIAIEGDIP